MEIKKTLATSLLIVFFSLLLFVSCEDEKNNSVQEKTYILASEKLDCQGFIAQKCFLVKENEQDNWVFFYSTIIGFNFEAGFEYKILVSEKEIENPPQDASSIEYTLINVISKIEKTSENLLK